MNVVADVVVHRAFASVLERSLQIADLEAKLHVLKTEVRNPSAKAITKIEAKLERLQTEQSEDIGKAKRSVCAFVTFENDEGKDAALALARALKLNAKKWKAKTTCMLPCEWLHPDPLLRPPDSNTPDFMFRDNLKLAIQRAKEPEDIQ
jgi:hypothetical protein